MQALILAGGLGTRLREVVNDRPKAMAPVNGKPFLEYQIKFLKNNGINEIVLSTGYKSEKIENYFGSGKNHGISIRYVKEKELLGTGGAVKNSLEMLDDQFFALNGDSIFLVNINSMLHFHNNNQADLTLALAKVEEKGRFGSVKVNDKSQVVEFVEKESIFGDLINGGIYFFKKSNFDWSAFPQKFSIEKDFFPKVMTRNKVFGFISDSYFIDIGTISDYQKFVQHIKSKIINL